MKRLFIIVMLLQVAQLPVRAEKGINFFQGSFNDALANAKEQNKLLFIDCYTTWCGPCKWMVSHVFNNDTVLNHFNKNFVCYKLDMEKGEGIDIAKRYSIKNYPTFLWLDGAGKQVHRSVGAAPSASFMRIANNASRVDGSLSYLEDQYKSGNRQPGFLLSYARALQDAYDMNYQVMADEFFRSQPVGELTSDASWKTILEFTPNINSYIYKYISGDPQPFYNRFGKDSVQKVLDELALESLRFASQQKDSVLLQKSVEKLSHSTNKDILTEAAQGELDYYKRNKNMAKYTAIAPGYVEKYFWNDAKILNAVGWTYFTSVNDKSQLAEADKWIAQSVKLDDKYYNTDTYANILHKQGKNKEAAEMTKHSIELAKQAGEDYASTQELLEEINKENNRAR